MAKFITSLRSVQALRAKQPDDLVTSDKSGIEV